MKIPELAAKLLHEIEAVGVCHDVEEYARLHGVKKDEIKTALTFLAANGYIKKGTRVSGWAWKRTRSTLKTLELFGEVSK